MHASQQEKKYKRREKAIADGTISIPDLANCNTSAINKVTKEGKDKTAVDHWLEKVPLATLASAHRPKATAERKKPQLHRKEKKPTAAQDGKKADQSEAQNILHHERNQLRPAPDRVASAHMVKHA